MPSRRFQPKRRHGCTTCKSRKVRCDLAQPVCANCTRLERECVYDDGEKVINSTPNSLSSAREDSFDLVSLKLMHNYTEATYAHISDNPHHLKVWQHHVPEIAFQQRFLLHGLLAVSALHLHHEKQAEGNRELLSLAHTHQAQALAEFIPLLSCVTDENCHALFAFSFVVATMSYALVGRVRSTNSSSLGATFLDDLVAIFDLLKGATMVAVSAKDTLRHGPLRVLMDDRHPLLDRDVCYNDLQLPDDLKRLLDHIEAVEFGRAPGRLECYKLSIQKLGVLLSSSAMKGVSPLGAVLGWPALVQIDYLTMLRSRDPPAMAVLAFYGAVLHRLDDVWFLRGIGSSIVSSVLDSIEEGWLPYLDNLKSLAT